MHMSGKGARFSLTRMVAAVAVAVAFALLAVPLGVAYAADTVVDTVGVNHVRTATMAASASEAPTLGAEKANDGSKEKASRWSSGTQVPAKDDKTFLSATFKAPTLIKRVEVTFENRDVDIKPSNVKGFELQYQDANSSEWKTAQVVSNKTSGSTGGFATEVTVDLKTAITAKAIRLTKFDVAAGSTEWNGVSVVELEAYSNDRTAVKTLDQVVSEIANNVTVEADAAQLPKPVVPEGFTVALNGCDFEQVVAADRTVVHPLTDKDVKISWTGTETKTGAKKTTGDLNYVIKGKNTQAEGKNARPVVVPEIQEWFSNSTAKVALSKLTKVTYQADELKAVVEEFVADYKDFTGTELKVVKGAAQAGAFNFTFGAPRAIRSSATRATRWTSRPTASTCSRSPSPATCTACRPSCR